MVPLGIPINMRAEKTAFYFFFTRVAVLPWRNKPGVIPLGEICVWQESKVNKAQDPLRAFDLGALANNLNRR
ncbi:hypothetical protein SGGMMB4_00183 [Sodalis glossinidius str. 'morsitans']|uniref:Uncharacterized protein n=1 Tax=Sodalis glossinidius (strain morsitans) TaxID=343509 RepID=A0A193QEW4_SODGM|nr:hypothetical protein SGGMMB4_00183 [Sodalis glossinidius str. 'morsitans']